MGIIGSCFKENTTKIPEKLNQAMKCLCNVNILNKINSGFLIKFQSEEKQNFLCISTNEPININEIKEGIKIIYGENSSKKIDLNDRYITNFIDKNYEITLIEILPKDKIEESYFLYPDMNYLNKTDQLKKLGIELLEKTTETTIYATGKIDSVNENEILYFLNRANISPGSLIFLKDKNEVLGMVKGGNSAYLLMDIYNLLKDELSKKNYKKIELEDNVQFFGEINEKNKPNGTRKYIFNNGELYEGDIIDGKFEGKGKYIYLNGEYYIGQFKEGLRNGNGVLYYKNGKIKYDGNFVNDKFEGKGKYIWENGDYYEGDFKNGLNEGKGKEFYSNGNLKYEGDFINDNYEGNGKFIYEEGDYYEGEFKEGLKDGKGIMYYKDGKIQYEGDFVKGKFEGKGKYIYENGDYYVGEFKNDMSNGKGTEYDKNGNVICEGEWVDDDFQN